MEPSNSDIQNIPRRNLLSVLDSFGSFLLYPLLLLGACLLRIGGTNGIEIISSGYLIAFLSNRLWTPHYLLQGRRMSQSISSYFNGL